MPGPSIANLDERLVIFTMPGTGKRLAIRMGDIRSVLETNEYTLINTLFQKDIEVAQSFEDTIAYLTHVPKEDDDVRPDDHP